MSYVYAKDKAKEWGLQPRQVCRYCREKRIPGAYRADDAHGSWVVPADAERPEKKKPGRKRGY